jgi:hypothetical protein
MTDHGATLRATWRIIADEATPPKDVANVDAWRQRVEFNARDRHHRRAQALLEFIPDATPQQLADAVRNGMWPEQLRAHIHQAATVAAQAANLRRSDEARHADTARPDWALGIRFISECRRYVDPT